MPSAGSSADWSSDALEKRPRTRDNTPSVVRATELAREVREKFRDIRGEVGAEAMAARGGLSVAVGEIRGAVHGPSHYLRLLAETMARALT